MAEKKPIKLADTMAGRIEQLADERHAVELGGGEDRLQKQRDRGKQTARERIDNLVDAYSFDEVGAFRKHRTTLFGMDKAEVPADGVVTGAASVNGRLVHLASQDFTVSGGSAGEVHSIKVAEIMEMSLKTGSPFVFIKRRKPRNASVKTPQRVTLPPLPPRQRSAASPRLFS